MEPFSWICPYCNKDQMVTRDNYDVSESYYPETAKSKHGKLALRVTSTVCLNEACKEVTLNAQLNQVRLNGLNDIVTRWARESWSLLPDSIAKIFPDYIPLVLRNDYIEACKIKSLSPKASATLSRRCIQGMIRDFCGISRKTLNQEIIDLKALSDDDKLPKGVQIEHIEAIDHVRAIGNIGAHFEQDINVIIEVDPDEANELIGLIEMLFDEWYVSSYKRQMKLAGLKSTREGKDKIKEEAKKAASE